MALLLDILDKCNPMVTFSAGPTNDISMTHVTNTIPFQNSPATVCFECLCFCKIVLYFLLCSSVIQTLCFLKLECKIYKQADLTEI
ncbi:hypothetical protein GDO78_011140 [Eleutherodactylus coqui]|uniref:Uncharacterized protein n=1 Tax=Eleutherodactylus coqui TaxID=57060 RepID=A0A8J6K741_ELECQ|nr:hypothetical protein GDO78_011140 [Eleutherodactylus coqui]